MSNEDVEINAALEQALISSPLLDLLRKNINVDNESIIIDVSISIAKKLSNKRCIMPCPDGRPICCT